MSNIMSGIKDLAKNISIDDNIGRERIANISNGIRSILVRFEEFKSKDLNEGESFNVQYEAFNISIMKYSRI
jgi:hypothetical protein